MKNIYEVLRQKEQQAEQLQKEIDALRLTIRILDEAEITPSGKTPDSRSSSVSLAGGSEAALAGNSTKRFP